MERFLTQKEISSYDENLLHEFGCNRKILEHYLGEIEEQYGHIVAIKKARPKIAKYFGAEMKKYFPSQKFVKKLDDGSIVFMMEYTQELEILPFVQRWLPDIVVVEPKELQDAFKKKLEEALGLTHMRFYRT